METNVRLYSLNYDEVKTYVWAAVFVGCNLLLPQLFHLIPNGGVIFAPLSFVILAGAFKFGWKPALLAALASPLVNHAITGMPAWQVMPLMTLKLAILAIAAGLAASRLSRRASHASALALLASLLVVVLVAEAVGALVELALTGGIAATIADLTVGWPGLLLQVFGTWLILTRLK